MYSTIYVDQYILLDNVLVIDLRARGSSARLPMVTDEPHVRILSSTTPYTAVVAYCYGNSDCLCRVAILYRCILCSGVARLVWRIITVWPNIPRKEHLDEENTSIPHCIARLSNFQRLTVDEAVHLR